MSTPSTALVRPPQATMAAWMIIVGSALVLFSSIETLTGLNSLQARELAEKTIDSSPGLKGLGVETMLRTMHIAAVVTAVCSAAMAVLGWFAWRRDRGARIGITVLAVPVFVGGTLSAGFFSALVAFSAILLWMEPTRSWFAGREAPAPPVRPGLRNPRGTDAPEAPNARPATPDLRPPTQDSSGGARRFQGYGSTEVAPSVPGDWVAPAAAPVSGGHLGAAQMSRPNAVIGAAVLTWVFATMFLVLALGGAVFALVEPDRLWKEALAQDATIADQGITIELLQAVMIGMCLMLVAMCVGAIVFSIGLMLRQRWGAIGLLSASLATALLCLLASLASPAMSIPAVAAVVVIVLLRRPDVRGWVLSAPKGHAGPPMPPMPPIPPYGQGGPTVGPTPGDPPRPGDDTPR